MNGDIREKWCQTRYYWTQGLFSITKEILLGAASQL